MSNISVGKQGEEIAKNYLIKNGYKIIDTNVRFSRFCEIDIIAYDKKSLVFVEVKTRSTTNYGHPFESINPKKLEHIYAAALY